PHANEHAGRDAARDGYAGIMRFCHASSRSADELAHLGLDNVPPPLDVVLERDAHHDDEEHETDQTSDLAHSEWERPPQDRFEPEEEQVAAVEHRNREQVDEAEVDRNDRHRPDEIAYALRALFTDNVVDGDRPAERRDAHLALHDPHDADD